MGVLDDVGEVCEVGEDVVVVEGEEVELEGLSVALVPPPSPPVDDPVREREREREQMHERPPRISS